MLFDSLSWKAFTVMHLAVSKKKKKKGDGGGGGQMKKGSLE